MKTSTWTAQLTVASSKAQHYLSSLRTTPKRPPSTSKFYVDFEKIVFKDQKIETHLLFLDVLRLVWHFFEQNNSRVRSFYLPRTHTRSSDGIFLHTRDFSLSKVTALKVAGADPGFFLGGGALVSCPTSTPINHIVFFFGRIPVVLENRRSSQGGGGGCAPPAPSP